MIKVTSKEKFNTSFGEVFVLEDPPNLHVGQTILINEKEYTIKRIAFPTRPTEKNIVSIFV